MQEAFGSVHRFNFHVHAGEIGAYLIGLILAKQTVVHENGAHVHACLMQQDGQHGAVHAAGDAADHLLAAHAFPDFPDELPLEVADIEFLEVGGAGEEVAQDGARFPVWKVQRL